MTKQTLTQLQERLDTGAISAVELAQDYLNRIEKAKALNAFVDVREDETMAQAKASDERRAKGEVGKLEGIPTGIKDLFCTTNFTATACSRI
jgi:Asp-tRNAAsn/Glu-tRNAGln amidotransferase A subunit and related amidases